MNRRRTDSEPFAPRLTISSESAPPDDAPSPEEIAQRCAAIREKWSERKHRKRAGTPLEPWTVPFHRSPAGL
ncbi:MAG: hypothetical protein KY476_09325 [Planctomycetes bacterium]|nr:hypothetical protein [Planctomycetota bacterium]